MTIERRVRIERDRFAEDPRNGGCNVGRMLCWHSRYNLGDEHNYDQGTWKRESACEADPGLEEAIDFVDNESYEIWAEEAKDAGDADPHVCANGRVQSAIKDLVDRAFDANYIALPLGLHDHSGISMYVGRGGCPWDSSYVGVIVCSKKKAREEYGEYAEKYLEAEVEVYDHYLRGNVWGYICEQREYGGCNACGREHDWEEVDSCWGFVGDAERMKSEVSAAFQDAFDEAILKNSLDS